MACVPLLAAALTAQPIPAGTALPVMLNSSLDAKKDKPGQKISARIMQDIPLPDGARLRAGSRLIGHIVEVSGPVQGRGSRLVFQFDQLLIRGRLISIRTSLRAIASMLDVFDAQLPTNALDDYGTSYNDWNTVQVGGDAVYRGSGRVFSADNQLVGSATIGGAVTAKLAAVPAAGCRGDMDGNDREQALWVFSATACGVYGFNNLKIAHAGRTAPLSEIALESSANLHVASGSGLLLRVVPSN